MRYFTIVINAEPVEILRFFFDVGNHCFSSNRLG